MAVLLRCLRSDARKEAVSFARSPSAMYAALISKSLQSALYNKYALFQWPTFAEMYILGEQIGNGASSVVKRAIHRKTNQNVAVKLITKGKASCLGMKDHRSEIACLRTLHHPHIVNLIDYFDEEEDAYVVLELVNGGELFKYMKHHGPFCEAETKHIVKQLLDAVIYCHDRNIVHRDIKPENILYTLDGNGKLIIKLADFGFATSVRGDNLSRVCGTDGYMAPEMIRRQTYGTLVDVWSIGIITYCLLFGFFPEIDMNGNVHFDVEQNISASAIECVEEMLAMEPSKRSTAKEVLSHPWFANKPPRSTGRKRTVDMFEIFSNFINDMLQFVEVCQKLGFGPKTMLTLETAADGLGMIKLYLSSSEPATISSMFTFLGNVVGSLVDEISLEEPDLIPVANKLQSTYDELRKQLGANCPNSHTLLACI